MADEVWLDVLPAMGGFGATMIKGATKAAKDAGVKAGKEYSEAFSGGADGAADAAIKELETAQGRASGLVSKLSGDVSKARQAQQKSAASLITAEQKLTDTVGKYGAESSQAEAATLRLEAARGKATDETKRFETAEEALKNAQKSHKTVTDQLATAQAELNTETKEAPGLWGKLSDSLGKAGGKVRDFSEGVGGTITKMAGAVGGVALLSDAFGNSMETETVVDKLNATLASTPEQAETYGAAAGNLYSQAYGESMSDVGTAVDAVVSSMAGMRTASQADIEKITANAMDLASAFDVDVSEAAATAGSLMKNGLAADATAAMDLIAGAMTKVPAAARAEILPIMDEYGKHFSALGIDGETAMGIIVASSADGAIGMDKMGDALKEFTIRGTDMSKGTMAAYADMGLSAEEMTNQLLAGGDTAEGAMGKIVAGLQNIKDPGEQAAAAISLFGTPLEDLGTDQIPAFLGMVDPMGDAFDSTAGSAAALSETLNTNTASSMETLKRSFQGMITDGVAPALGPLTAVMDWATKTPGVMTAVGVALAIVAVGWAAVTLAASPWLLLGVGIALVIGGIILVVKNMGGWIDWLRTNALEPFLNWISPAWAALGTMFDAVYQSVLKPVFEGIGAAANWLWESVLQPVFGWISEAWTNWTGHAKTVYDAVLKPVFEGIGAVANWLWTSVLQPVFGWIGDGWNLLGAGIKLLWDTVLKPAWDAVAAGAMWLYEFGIKPALGFIGDIWSGLVRGIGDTWNQYGVPIFSMIGDLLKGDFVGAFDHAKTAVDRIWKGIANVVRKPINFVVKTVYNDGLRSVFNKIAGLVGIGELPEAPEIPAFAKGGLHQGGWALVGEQGPELVNFDNPGRVYTADDTQNMLSGRTQAPEGALQMLAGSSPADAKLPAGGLIGDAWAGIGKVGSAIGGGISDAISGGINWVRGGLAKAAEPLVNMIKGGLNTGLGTEGIGLWINKAAGKMLDGALGWIRGKDESANAEMAKAGGGSSAAQFDGSRGPAHRPSAGPYTSGYGPRWGGFHAGVDIAGGGPTYAYQNGVVAETGWNIGPGRSGIGILLNHGKDFYTYYGHNPVGGVQVQPGQEVQGGQRIGSQGATGNVTGVHTHFETHVGSPWANVNPMSYLYDQGGILEPGFTPVVNKTRKPEAIYTNSQNRDLQELAARGVEAAGSGTTLTAEDIREALDGMDMKLQTEAGVVLAKLVNSGVYSASRGRKSIL